MTIEDEWTKERIRQRLEDILKLIKEIKIILDEKK